MLGVSKKKIRRHGRRPRPGEAAKHAARQAARAETITVRDDGAGARSIEDPQRHHRSAAGTADATERRWEDYVDEFGYG